MDVLQLFFLFLFVLHMTLSKHIVHRNLLTQRVCCKRQSHFVYIGQDISGSPVSVDVGMCRSRCGMAIRSSHEARQQEYSKHSSMLEFLRSKKMQTHGLAAPEISEPVTRLPSCGANQMCEPTGMRVERLLLFEGPRQVEVIEECHCEVELTHCIRVPALRTYYFETPYTTVIDVGGCSHSKGTPVRSSVKVIVANCTTKEGFSCVATKFDSALLETPNKVDVVQTVSACELKKSCYRVPHVEYYYETVQHADGFKEERLKEVDVGRCMGGCTTGNRCLLRSPSDLGNCLLWSDRQSSSCVPQGYESHSFINQHEQLHTILSITSCRCQN